MIEKELIDNTMERYGDNYSQHYFDQYRIYLESIEKISDRRESANKYFFALNSGIIICAGFLLNSNMSGGLVILALLVLDVLGIVFSVIGWLLINSYKQLNSGKFKVLHRMEERLPIKMYSDEWRELGGGKDMKKYFPFSHIERLVPVIFGVIYLLFLTVINFIIINFMFTSCY